MADMFRPHARRGRRALCWALAVFLTVQLTGGLLLDYWWTEVRFPTAALTLKSLSQQPRSPDILCLGSSRFGAGFDQDAIRNLLQEQTSEEWLTVFNAAIEAGDLVTADYIMDHALEKGVRPRIVVIEVSPETLARRSEWMGQHVLRQLTWGDLPGHLGDIWRSQNLVRLASARLLPLHMHRRQICRQLWDAAQQRVTQLVATPKPGKQNKKAKTKPASQGVPWEIFMELRDDKPDAHRTSAGLPAIRRWLKDYAVGGGSGRALERLLGRCHQWDIKVILVGVPVTQAHRQLYTPEIEHAFLCRMVDVSRRHGCQFVDYRARIPDEWFLDNHHLRHSGGEHFSRLLTQEVLLPAWLSHDENGSLAISR